MNNNLKMIIIVLTWIIVLFLFQTKYSDYNTKRTISACMMAIKKTSDNFDPIKAKKFCEEKINKKLK